jgi:hypothetical protein
MLGHTFRVSLFDAETARSRRYAGSSITDATKVAEAKAITEALVATQLALMQGGGSRENPYIISTSVNDTGWLHRPGYRLSDNSNDDDPPRRRRKTTERDPMGREKAAFEKDALNATEVAYRDYLSDTQNAWRTDAVLPNQGASTRAIPASSATGDRWPLSAGAGNPCNTNGRPGKLAKSEDGSCLVCAVDPIQATRADAMTAADAARINTAAYEEMCTQLREAWRS